MVPAAEPPARPPPRPRTGPSAVLMGLIPTIQAGHPELRCAWLDLDPATTGRPAGLLSDEPCLALRGGIAYRPEIARIVPLPDKPCRLIPGDGMALDAVIAVAMRAARPRRGPGPDHCQRAQFQGHAGSPGPRSPGAALGLEAAGEVIAVGAEAPGSLQGTMSSCSPRAPSPATSPCRRSAPPNTRPSFRPRRGDAAIAFLTAWRGLIELAGLQPGQRVLVHAGAGGVGLAAVQLAVWAGARVFATASSGKQAWALLAGAEATASSRDTSFVAAVRAWSGGTGVDLVLHALGDEMATASRRCCARAAASSSSGMRRSPFCQPAPGTSATIWNSRSRPIPTGSARAWQGCWRSWTRARSGRRGGPSWAPNRPARPWRPWPRADPRQDRSALATGRSARPRRHLAGHGRDGCGRRCHCPLARRERGCTGGARRQDQCRGHTVRDRRRRCRRSRCCRPAVAGAARPLRASCMRQAWSRMRCSPTCRRPTSRRPSMPRSRVPGTCMS